MGDFRKLNAWQASLDLAAETYRITKHFPSDERFGLTQQARRAAVSISSNIAEGAGRGGRLEFCRFLRMSRGSLQELRSQIHLSVKLGFMREEEAEHTFHLATIVSRLLSGLLRPDH